MKTRDLYRALNAINRAIPKIEKMNEKYPKLYISSLKEIGEHVIDKWYESYPPIYYADDRYGSLYHAYDIRLEGTRLIVDFDKSYMDEYVSRAINGWIYENSFENGYHGGAIPKGSTDKIPLWRTPHPFYTQWGRPALYTFSPSIRMEQEMRKKVKEINQKKQEEFDAIIAPVERAVGKIL